MGEIHWWSIVADHIIISKKNEVHLRIICQQDMAKELSGYFTFFVPGYNFSPKFKSKIWDGKIRLFNLRDNTIYYGLLPYIIEFCKSRDYTYEFDETCADVEDEFSLYHGEKFVKSLNLHSGGKPIEIRDFQLESFCDGMQRKRRLFVSPTASGKSLILYLFFRQFLDYQGLKGLVIVPTTSLVEQLYGDFIDYSSDNGFDVDANVHRIYEGKSKDSDKKLYISTWQSIYKQPPEYFKQFDYILGDEAHSFKAQSLTTIMTQAVNTKYRIGVTGTLDGTKTHKLVLEGLFGESRKVITTKELMDRGDIAVLDIKCLILKHSEAMCKLYHKADYQTEISYLIGNEYRNKFIKNLALSLKGNTLILYSRVAKHGKLLYDMIKDSENIGTRKVFFIHGNTETDEREMIRKLVATENDAILVASYGTFSTGINAPNLHNVIFASPSRSIIRVCQSIGRSLRLAEGKTHATLFDIADDLRHGKALNHTLDQFVSRTKIYTEEKFSFKIYKIGLKDGNQR